MQRKLVHRDTRRWVRWGLALIWMALIFVLSAQPSLPYPPDAVVDVVLKKLAHVMEYGVLALMVWWALHPRDVALDARWFLAAFAVTVLYALSDEWHQTFVPGRHGNVYDWTVDLAGAGIALVVLRIVLLRRARYCPDGNLPSVT